MKIYVFGNPLVEEDSLPLHLLPDLKKTFPIVDFAVTDPNENFPPNGEKDLLILDTVKGVKKPMLLTMNDFQNHQDTPVSPHDYDLLFHLLLLYKLKKIDSVNIIAVPNSISHTLILDGINKIISTLLLGSERRKTYKGQKP